MGIFNEQSLDHPFAKGIQGAPGVGLGLPQMEITILIKKDSQMLEHPVIILMLLQKNT